MSRSIKNLRIYHIVHVDRLASIVSKGGLYCDARMQSSTKTGTSIGMRHIKKRRKNNKLKSYPDLSVGDCVPFYFCRRSRMLYIIHMDNDPSYSYHGGQNPIVYLEADLYETVDWAKRNEKRWVFTTSNAGADYFCCYRNLEKLNEITWPAVRSKNFWKFSEEWKEKREAEFLIEYFFPWELVRRIGVREKIIQKSVQKTLKMVDHQPPVKVKPSWYF